MESMSEAFMYCALIHVFRIDRRLRLIRQHVLSSNLKFTCVCFSD